MVTARRWDWRVVGAIFALICATFASENVFAQTEEAYRLGVEDRLRVKIGRWRAAQGSYENWDGLGGEYVVGPNGTVSFALAGSVPALGRTPAEVAEDISRRIQERIGLDQMPAISVEIAEFRPVYVVGAVNKPGEYPFRPQLSVLQAIGLAGGHLRAASAILRTESDALRIVGEYRVLRLQRWSKIALIARLKAELAGAQEIEMPKALAEAPNASELLRMEGEILAARNETVTSKKLAIEDLKRLLATQIEKLGEETKIRDRQVELVTAELKNVRSLKERGLVVSSRESGLARTVTESQAKQLVLQVAKLQAEQQLNEAVRDELDLVNERRRRIVTELRKARENLEQIDVRLQTTKALFSEAASLGGGLVDVGDIAGPVFQLTRQLDGQVSTQIVDEQDLMRPGDTLQVIAPELEPTERSDNFPNVPG